LRALGEELYDREAISILDGQAFQGRSGRLLEGADFYTVVGRPDLAESYRDRQSLKSVVRVTGGVAIGVGIIWGIIDVLGKAAATAASAFPCLLSGGTEGSGGSSSGGSSSWCQPMEPSALPWATAGVGLGMVVVPAFVPTDPIPEAERDQLARRHNDELRAKAAPAGPARPSEGPWSSMRAGPYLTPQGGGLMISGRF
jgi:hypothetical protein